MGRTRKTTSHANASLGMSLVKKKKIHWDRATNCEHPELSQDSTTGLKSVTEENSYDEFIATATLANKEFTAEKLNVKFVALATSGSGVDDEFTEEDKRLVVVPRRPKWTKEMTAEELDEAEREAFLQWRRTMAHLQNKEGITPFERNIEVWRQLWRVVERSHVVVQIVDARHPLLYRCDDLESYVREMGKGNILLVNKADFLSSKQREAWSTYFRSINLPHAFYSAANAAKKLTTLQEKAEGSSSEESESDTDAVTEGRNSRNQADDEDSSGTSSTDGSLCQQEEKVDPTRILDREELITFLRSFRSSSKEELFAVGLVGYPNVGKSSTINSLMGAKLTSVSATPGKTKHFQTLFLEDDILLCDCPGLVMPAFGGSKGEMVLGGILPIDQLTSYNAATDLLVKRVPTLTLQGRYGVTLPPNYTHEDFLNSYASLRGFMTVRGIPDCSRASRIVLKDYVNGKLCYCHPPPGVDPVEFQPLGFSLPEEEPEASFPLQANTENQRPLSQKTRMEKSLDHHFFAPLPSSAHVKGRQMVSDGVSSASSSSSGRGEGKPWKKHGNRNKKEKLRRVYRHLDVE